MITIFLPIWFAVDLPSSPLSVLLLGEYGLEALVISWSAVVSYNMDIMNNLAT
jgi:hypothetical protein